MNKGVKCDCCGTVFYGNPHDGKAPLSVFTVEFFMDGQLKKTMNFCITCAQTVTKKLLSVSWSDVK
jgi:hypothetical protein